MKARERMLARVRRALAGRPEAALPPVPEGPALSKEEVFSLFKARLSAAGARVERLSSLEEARGFLKEAEAGAKAAWVSPLVPGPLRPELPEAPPEEAELGVSRAAAGVAETGSVVLSSREGRRGQLLVPRHLVWLFEDDLYGTLLLALRSLRGEDASALALHSGPSKSADIGQIMVKGVHGPGELWVGVLEIKVKEVLMTDFVWERVKNLKGKTLTTKDTGQGKAKPFLVKNVTDKTIVILPASSGRESRVRRVHIEQAVELISSGVNFSSVADIRKHLGNDVPASYIWTILHELGYV